MIFSSRNGDASIVFAALTRRVYSSSARINLGQKNGAFNQFEEMRTLRSFPFFEGVDHSQEVAKKS